MPLDAKKIINDDPWSDTPIDLEMVDAALDYAEQVVGRWHFPDNWRRFPEKENRVKLWLSDRGYTVSPADVIAYLDWIATTGQKWQR